MSFEYSTEKGGVLHSVSLSVPAGKTIAIVGRSGQRQVHAGRRWCRASTTSTAGQVLVDGVDVRECNLRDLRANVALVSQDVLLFNDSIRNNIAFGVESPDPKAVEAAATRGLRRRVRRRRCRRVSTRRWAIAARCCRAARRQRIAIARALLKDAPILILDEATSALDNESERRIQQALVELMRNRTTLVIAHRLTTIEHADEIVVMEEGRIVERGTHAELVGAQRRVRQPRSARSSAIERRTPQCARASSACGTARQGRCGSRRSPSYMAPSWGCAACCTGWGCGTA